MQVQGIWIPSVLLSRSESAGVGKVRGLQELPCAQEHLCCPEVHFVVKVLVCAEPQVSYCCPALSGRISPVCIPVFPCCAAALPGCDVPLTRAIVSAGRGCDVRETWRELAKQTARAIALLKPLKGRLLDGVSASPHLCAPQGAAGPRGPAGVPGFQGYTGHQGVRGVAGAKGEPGRQVTPFSALGTWRGHPCGVAIPCTAMSPEVPEGTTQSRPWGKAAGSVLTILPSPE